MMKKIKILSLLVCLIALFTACHDEEDKTNYGSRTVLVYIAGDNSLSRFASEDLNEMIEGMQSVDDNRNNLLVYMDKGSNPCLSAEYETILCYAGFFSFVFQLCTYLNFSQNFSVFSQKFFS